jgi:hypothetical protein
VGRVRDNTVTTTVPSSQFRSSRRADQMCVSTAFGRIWHLASKVEGLVVRLDRGSSNLPGRIGKPRKRGVFCCLGARAVLAVGNVGTRC